jgi:uncharacterized tellurite resistance protein B-like protein
MNERFATCLLIAKVLVADGMMADHEREFLTKSIETFGLTDDEAKRVRNLEGFEEAEHVIAGLSVEKRRAVVDRLIEAALVDGKLSPHETKTVAELTKALGLA